MNQAQASFWTRPFKAPSQRVLFAAIGLWLAWLSWIRPFKLPDEGRYPGVALDMLRSGSNAVPLLNGMPYFHKPPLFYWMVELSFSVFGVHPWAARVPSWLAAWAAVVGLYYFLRRYRGEKIALIAVLALVTQPYFYGGAQFANLDMLVASLITLATLAGADTMLRVDRGEPWRRMSVATGALAGLALLAKGLIGVVLPGGILVFWMILRRRATGLGALLWPPAIVAFAVVAVPWCWWMQKLYPDFFNYFFVYQHFERFADSDFNNKQPLLYYLPVVAGLALPWTLWLGGVFRKPFWADRQAFELRGLMVIWIATVLVFFSIPASKLIGYALPVLAPLAVLVAEVIVAALARSEGAVIQKWARISLVVAAALCVVITICLGVFARPNAYQLGLRIKAEFAPGDQLVMLHSYPFDLPMAVDMHTPAWVVDNWDNPRIPLRDSWRKELYDAGLFEPEVMRQALISPAELIKRVCAAPASRSFWVWGESPDDANRYLELAGMHPYVTDGRFGLWRVQADDAFKARNCGGTPTAG
jgi:4-amino-4-deoxy-L-arabinose transferase-like glycosyltransferase